MPASGLDNLRRVIGRELTRVVRCVLGLGRTNDAFGHGITELHFGDVILVVRPGPNEDYLVIENGPVDRQGLDPAYWTELNLEHDHGWALNGRLQRVLVFADDIEDVALIFEFDSGGQFSIVLCDTDVAIGRGIERFEGDPNKVKPVLRTTFVDR